MKFIRNQSTTFLLMQTKFIFQVEKPSEIPEPVNITHQLQELRSETTNTGDLTVSTSANISEEKLGFKRVYVSTVVVDGQKIDFGFWASGYTPAFIEDNETGEKIEGTSKLKRVHELLEQILNDSNNYKCEDGLEYKQELYEIENAQYTPGSSQSERSKYHQLLQKNISEYQDGDVLIFKEGVLFPTPE